MTAKTAADSKIRYRVYYAETLQLIREVGAVSAADAKRQVRKLLKRGYRSEPLFADRAI